MLHLFSEFITCLLAILIFRKLDAFSRLIAVQVCIAFLVEFLGWQMRLHLQRNTWLYNCYMPVEFSLLFIATRQHFKSRILAWLLVLLVFYWSCWCAEIYYQSIHVFAVKTYVIGALILLVSYFFVLYKSAWNRMSLFKQSQFWFAIGVILFFGCNIPFFSMYDYIVENSTDYQMDLLTNLMMVFTHFRYLCTAIGFILVFLEFKNNKQKLIANAE
ncbi:MAG: hypothetical protein WC716_02455 [Chitinophagaceae bacterium]